MYMKAKVYESYKRYADVFTSCILSAIDNELLDCNQALYVFNSNVHLIAYKNVAEKDDKISFDNICKYESLFKASLEIREFSQE